MINDPIVVGFGLAVVAAGGVFLLLFARVPRQPPLDRHGQPDEQEYAFLVRRAGRRQSVSIAILLCGLLFMTSGLVDAQARPRLSFLLAMATVPILLWAVAAAIGDWWITRRRITRELEAVGRTRERYERELAEHRENQPPS